MWPEERLVTVDADTPDAAAGGRGERSEPTFARDVEDRPGAARDLAAGEGGTLRLVEEIVRVVHQHLDARCGSSSAGGESDDEVPDRRNLHPAHDADDVAAGAAPLELPGEPAGEIRGLARPENDALEVPRRPLEDRAGRVHQGEGHSGMLRHDRTERGLELLSERDDELVSLTGEQTEEFSALSPGTSEP